MTAGLTGVGWWHLDLISNSPWRGWVFGSFLLYEPGYLGILPMYCFFHLLTPVVLWQFQRENWRYVLFSSAVVWVTAGLVMKTPENPYGVDFGAFNPLSYQFLFVLGLAFGTGQVSIERLSPGHSQGVVRFMRLHCRGCVRAPPGMRSYRAVCQRPESAGAGSAPLS